LKFENLVQDHRVHRRIYVEADIFADEMERIFESGRIFFGRDSEITNPGDYERLARRAGFYRRIGLFLCRERAAHSS